MRYCVTCGGARFVLALIVSLPALAEDPKVPPDFGNLSLDQLANVKVTSFTGRQQKLSQVAGAVYVITREQITRSGLTSVPELLRLAPGVDVGQVNGNQWSVSARGPVGIFANKLLVLIDGRSIYSPLFSGVYWELGMPRLEDIDRIEVIRGPGATIWGANAVLGVINIITRSSRETHGASVTSGGGSSQRAFGSAAIGGELGSTSYRGGVAMSDSSAMSQPSGASAGDGWNSMQAGFRLDGSHKRETWMVEGNLFRATENATGVNVSPTTVTLNENPSRFNSLAGDLTGEWRHRLSETGELRLRSDYDYANRPEPQASKVETRTWDTELKYDFVAGRIHNLSVGGGERLIAEKIDSQSEFTFAPAGLTYNNLNGFAQDEMHFMHDSLFVTIGAKLEHNHFSGWGTEPSANLMWMPTKRRSLWISAAGALRTPTLFEQAVHAPFGIVAASDDTGGLPVVVNVSGSPSFGNEAVKDFEAGYREQLSKSFSADVTVFYDRFSGLRSFTSSYPVPVFSPVPHLDLTQTVTNNSAGRGRGGEGSIAWQVSRDWKLEGSYTYNIVSSYLTPSAPPGSVDGGPKEPSRNKWRLQSYVNLSKSWKLDSFLYWTSKASPSNDFGRDILTPSYTRLDVRLGYKPGPHWQLSLAGQNLLQARHLEAQAELLTAASYVKRSVYLKSTWQF